MSSYTLIPGEVGVQVAAGAGASDARALAGGSPQENAEVTRAIFAGEPGERAELASINAGAAIYAAGAVESIADGVAAAREALAGGQAAEVLERFVQASNRHASVEAAAR